MAFKVLAAIFLGVAVVSGGTYLVLNNAAKVGDEGGEKKAETYTGGSNTLRGLLTLGENVTCTFSSQIEGSGTTEGVVFVSDGKMRGDFNIEQNGSTFQSHVIIRDEKMYAWNVSGDGTFAYEFDFADLEGRDTVVSNSSNNVSLDERVDYDCNPWSVDASKFSLPAGIDFQKYEDMFNAGLDVSGSVGGGVSGSDSQCATCEQILDENVKAQCLAALSCN
jgi:hypothetical protein